MKLNCDTLRGVPTNHIQKNARESCQKPDSDIRGQYCIRIMRTIHEVVQIPCSYQNVLDIAYIMKMINVHKIKTQYTRFKQVWGKFEHDPKGAFLQTLSAHTRCS